MTVEKIHVDQLIHSVVREIPEGKVATYGQIASLAGLAGRARRVGYALRVVPETTPIPWHRVVNARGQISCRSSDVGSEQTQYLRLRFEGVRFSHNGRISLKTYQWRPAAEDFPEAK